MAAKTPIQEELDHNEKIVKPSLLEWVGIFFGFLWFIRRIIVGTILLACLLYGIYKVYMIPPKTFDDEPAIVVKEKEIVSELPTANIDFAPLMSDTFTEDSGKPKIRTFEDIEIPEEEEIVPYDPLFDTGTVDELVEAILDLRDRWPGKDEPIVFLMNQRRARLARRLMELEITDDQQIFSLSEYIESVVVLDMIANQEKMKAPEIRVAIEEIVSKYLRHDYPTIRAKASLAHVSIPLHDFAREQKSESLDDFAARLDLFADQVFEDPVAAARLGSMALWLRKLRDWDGTSLPYCVELVNKMNDSRDPKIRIMGTSLQEKIFFQHLEPNDLVARLGQGDKEVRGVIQEFFQGIDANPNVRLVFYQVAVSVIEQCKRLEQKEDYESLLEWLQRISEKISSKAKKKEVLSAITKLEALPWGPRIAKPKTAPNDLPSALRNREATN